MFLSSGGFEQIKAAVLFAPQTDDALMLAGSAAHGGSRHEAKSVSTYYDRLCTVKKSPSPAAGTSGHEYVLYHVNQLHITSSFARWVCDLPGECAW